MQTFKKEIATILMILRGSLWATHPEVKEVLSEYDHLAKAAWTLASARRVSLQIFHASRAIDSLLAHIARHEASKPGKGPVKQYYTLESSLNYIRQKTIGGSSFTKAMDDELKLLKDTRNRYLHTANVFPPEDAIRSFLSRTTRALKEASTFPP